MFGLILDYYWSSTNQDPVNVTLVGTLAQLRATKQVNPQDVVDAWSRADVVPVEVHNVSSDFGGMLHAHICATVNAYAAALEDLAGGDL